MDTSKEMKKKQWWILKNSKVDMKCKHIDNDEFREQWSMKIVRRQKMIKNYA
jgi:hypothetical protein